MKRLRRAFPLLSFSRFTSSSENSKSKNRGFERSEGFPLYRASPPLTTRIESNPKSSTCSPRESAIGLPQRCTSRGTEGPVQTQRRHSTSGVPEGMYRARPCACGSHMRRISYSITIIISCTGVCNKHSSREEDPPKTSLRSIK